MVQYLELVLKRDVTSGWRHRLERFGAFFDSPTATNSNNEAEGSNGNETPERSDWQQRFGKNWYY